MRPTRWIFLSLAVLAINQGILAKSKPLKPKSNLLDTAAIHQVYLDGDFDEAIDRIETALKYGGPFSHEDSVFAFKHLGVMYTAKYETREKGKQYMMRLLQVEPTARIMDMYASDMIYMIFKNIKDEFEMSQAKLNRARDQMGDPTAQERKQETESGKSSERKGDSEGKSRGYAWIAWTAGAVAVAGGAALLVHMNEEDAAPTRKENLLK